MRSTHGRSAPTRTVCRQRSRSPCARCLHVGPRTQPRRPAGGPRSRAYSRRRGGVVRCRCHRWRQGCSRAGRRTRARDSYSVRSEVAADQRLRRKSGHGPISSPGLPLRPMGPGRRSSRWVDGHARERHVASRLLGTSHRTRIPDMSPTRRRSPSSFRRSELGHEQGASTGTDRATRTRPTISAWPAGHKPAEAHRRSCGRSSSR